MKVFFAITLLIGTITYSKAQEVINLPYKVPENIHWYGGETNKFSGRWKTQIVANVSTPSIQVFKPDSKIANGTAVVIAPGGGLYALSISSEGAEVAKWLNSKGITAFVLKYRLVPTKTDAPKELADASEKKLKVSVKEVLPFSIKDGLAAITYVRSNAEELGVSPNKVGFMGFSAGGLVTMGVAFESSPDNRPDFIVPIYPWMVMMDSYEVQKNAPPMLIICAADDPLKLAPLSVKLYSDWREKGKSAELHMYSRGGHGFGMRKQNLPTDKWIERFYDWALAEELVKVPE